MKVLVLGGGGMLGHKLVQVLSTLDFETVAVLRAGIAAWPAQLMKVRAVAGPDANNVDGLAELLDAEQPAAVLNAIGVIKQIIGDDQADTIAVNALFPHRLAALCRARGIRLVHFSTDCVFSGTADSARGPLGYREHDLPDARDVYGLSKMLGEPVSPGCLVLRTSIIGRELRGRHSLVEWFLAQSNGPVRGFRNALFSGLPTIALARLTAALLLEHPNMHGVWHVSADPIRKSTLLSIIKKEYRQETEIVPDESYYCDRRLDSSLFREAMGWNPPSWGELISMMHDDPFRY